MQISKTKVKEEWVQFSPLIVLKNDFEITVKPIGPLSGPRTFSRQKELTLLDKHRNSDAHSGLHKLISEENHKN